MERIAEISRITKETDIYVKLNIDGSGANDIASGIGFFDHLLDAFSKHSLIDLEVKCKGDLHIDSHHSCEDISIAIGMALNKALGDKRGITRYGYAYAPLDEALSRAVIDIAGRPYFDYSSLVRTFDGSVIGGGFYNNQVLSGEKGVSHAFPYSLVSHCLRSICINAGFCAHISLFQAEDAHHAAESLFKAFALALKQAALFDARRVGTPSTKGVL